MARTIVLKCSCDQLYAGMTENESWALWQTHREETASIDEPLHDVAESWLLDVGSEVPTRDDGLTEEEHLRKTIIWITQMAHQAYHEGGSNWRDCNRSICEVAAQAVGEVKTGDTQDGVVIGG